MTSEAQEAVLRALTVNEGLSVREIAQRVGFSEQAVYWSLNRLLRLGLSQRRVRAGGRWRYEWIRIDAAGGTERPSGGRQSPKATGRQGGRRGEEGAPTDGPADP